MAYRDDPPELAARRRGAYLPVLDRVTVTTACRERWDAMVGDDRVRHCKVCDQQVYNVIAMATAEVEALVAAVAGGAKVCGRLHRRPDGTIITADCVAARAAKRSWAGRVVGLGAALLATGAVAAITTAGSELVDHRSIDCMGGPIAEAPDLTPDPRPDPKPDPNPNPSPNPYPNPSTRPHPIPLTLPPRPAISDFDRLEITAGGLAFSAVVTEEPTR